MVKRGRIEPTLNKMTSNTGNVMQRDPGASGQIMSALGEQLGSAAEMFKRVSVAEEKLRAENERDKLLKDIQTRAANDPDISEERLQVYADEIDNAISNTSQIIRSPEERSFFELASKSSGDISRARVAGGFMKKKIEAYKANSDIKITNLRDEYILADNPKAKQKAILDRNAFIDEMVQVGAITPGEAIEYKDTQDRQWGKAQVQYDIETNPEMAKELLEGKKYPNIAEEDRVELLNLSKDAITKKETESIRQTKQAQYNLENDLDRKLFEGSLTLNELDENKDGVSGEYLLSRKKALLTPDPMVSLKDQAVAFNELQEQLTALKIDEDNETESTIDEIMQFKNNVINAMGDGRIKSTKGEKFISMVSGAYQGKLDEGKGFNIGKALSAIPFWSIRLGWKTINNWTEKNAESGDVEAAKMRMQEKVMDVVSEGKTVEEGLQAAMGEEKARLNKNPQNYQVGDVIKNTLGVQGKITGFADDGTPLIQVL
jgi:hypothetical protein